MFKFILFLIIFALFPLQSVHAQKQEEPNRVTVPLLQESQEQDFYKATVQAYKDFNEQVVSSISTALVIVSGFATVLVFVFVFLFRKTLAEIRKDIKDDSEMVQDVYSKTFELLNEQAKTNLEIFKSRESELRTTIKEARGLYENIRDAMRAISDNQKVREPIAEKLAQEEVEKAEGKRKEIESEVEDFKKDLEPFTKNKEQNGE